MELITLIKGLFMTPEESLLEIKELHKQQTLDLMAKCYHRDGEGLVLLGVTDVRQELASLGFIQIFDIEKKESPAWCMISSKGLNHLGYPGR